MLYGSQCVCNECKSCVDDQYCFITRSTTAAADPVHGAYYFSISNTVGLLCLLDFCQCDWKYSTWADILLGGMRDLTVTTVSLPKRTIFEPDQSLYAFDMRYRGRKIRCVDASVSVTSANHAWTISITS